MGDKKYDIKELEELANAELIWPEASKLYRDKLKETIQANKWGIDVDDPDCENAIVHEELWWDCCKIINELAQELLNEKEKRVNFLNEVRGQLKESLDNLSDEKFEKYY